MDAAPGEMGEDNCKQLLLFVNGKKIVAENPDPEDTLLQFLRDKCNLKGTKLGCAEGGCGACTVMVSVYEEQEKKIQHYSVNACLAPLVSLHGCAVTTVEGIGSTKTRLHAVQYLGSFPTIYDMLIFGSALPKLMVMTFNYQPQERLAESHGSQCGFCTPGIVMSMYTLLRNNPQPSQMQMEKAFEGNLCRCTGYRPILEGFKSFTCPMGENCCKNGGSGGEDSGSEQQQGGDRDTELGYDPTQEPIFPPELKLGKYNTEYRHYTGERIEWYRPTDLQTLLKLKQQNPSAKLVCGNTEVGVEVKFKNQLYPVIVAPTHVPELNHISIEDTGIWFGASTTLTKLEHVLQEQIKSQPEHKTRIYKEIVEMLRWFAGHQIRNVSSMAGNLMTASPISDLNPLYLAAGVKIRLHSAGGGVREIRLDDKFFISYRKIAVAEDEILLSIHIPTTTENEYFIGYKQAHRKEDDIATVNSGIRVRFDESLNKVEEISLAFGGMAPITKCCVQTSEGLNGKIWDESLLEEGIRLLKEDLPLSESAPGGMISYRRTLTISFFYKFFLTVKQQLAERSKLGDLPARDLSATTLLERGPTKGIQIYSQEDDHSVGECWKAVPHKSAALQCTGEAQYIDDLPAFRDELYMALVTSTVAHAEILSIDTSEALSCPGVIDFVSASDVPGSNVYSFNKDEFVFADKEVTCIGHVIGAILANTQRHAQTAAKKVKVQYKELPAILTIEQAIAAESYHTEKAYKLWSGDVDSEFSKCEVIMSGEIRVGGQEHFYLETNAAICIARENGEMEIYCSSQNPTQIQMSASEVLRVPSNRINVRVKRMGGGFGGKETRTAALVMPAAICTNKHNLPVRCMLDRDEDMVITGTRHSFLGKYKVGCDKDGRIICLDVFMYSNGGNTKDLSIPVLQRGLYSIDNAYKIPNMRIQGHVCKTNIPSNTAFRGFGGPQGMMIMEHIISEISARLNIPDHQIREMHLLKEGNVTHYGQPVEHCQIEKCWKQVLDSSNYGDRLQQVEKYNRENRWRKRGICALPTKFGISFTESFMNQAGALVHIYNDGNVLVSHGGTEMGQGLFTKMIQVASTALGIPADKIYTMETSTTTVPNTSPTAASTGSDLNGGAVLNACTELNKRLEGIKKAKPDASWEEWISTAYFTRISLSATGYYATPDLNMDWKTSRGRPFSYFSYGAAVSEVEIDCLTGDHQVLRTDIVMDVGKSLNPAIDIGQIEGGFIQGYGLFCLEQLKIMSGKGHLLTRGPGAYKIPGFGNIPQEFNVTLLKDVPNVKAVYSSKAIGEPPLFLSASVFLAIKSAIRSAREDCGKSREFRLDSPCTPERIRMSCPDHLTAQFTSTDSTQIPEKSFFVEP